MFYNDSCSTVPQSAVAACASFRQRTIFIGGGTDKGLDFTSLADTLSGKDSDELPPIQVYLLSGTGTDNLIPLLEERGVAYLGPFDSLEVLLGVLKANLIAPNAEEIYDYHKDDAPIPVVFSPGATSFGMFVNEFDRGDTFKDMVKNIYV